MYYVCILVNCRNYYSTPRFDCFFSRLAQPMNRLNHRTSQKQPKTVSSANPTPRQLQPFRLDSQLPHSHDHPTAAHPIGNGSKWRNSRNYKFFEREPDGAELWCWCWCCAQTPKRCKLKWHPIFLTSSGARAAGPDVCAPEIGADGSGITVRTPQ